MFTIKNVSATTPRVLHLSFDKQGQSDIAEVAKQSISLPAGFPKDKFLALFEEWKLARNNPDPTNGGNDRSKYFAQLRDMHQQYGINAGSLRNADEDMLLFGEYVRKTQTIIDDTRGAIVAPPRSGGPVIVPPLSTGESYIDNEEGKLLGEFGDEFSTAKVIVNNKEYAVKQLTRATKEVRIRAKADTYVIELDKPHNPDTNSDKLYFKKESGKWVPVLVTANSYSVAIIGGPADKVVKFTSKNSQISVPSSAITTGPVVVPPNTPSVAPAAPARSLSSSGVAPTAPGPETKPGKTPAEIMAAKIVERDLFNEKNFKNYKAELEQINREHLDEAKTGGDDGVDEKTLKTLITALLLAKSGEDRSQAVLKLQTELSSYEGMEKLARDGWLGEATMIALRKVVEPEDVEKGVYPTLTVGMTLEEYQEAITKAGYTSKSFIGNKQPDGRYSYSPDARTKESIKKGVWLTFEGGDFSKKIIKIEDRELPGASTDSSFQKPDLPQKQGTKDAAPTKPNLKTESTSPSNTPSEVQDTKPIAVQVLELTGDLDMQKDDQKKFSALIGEATKDDATRDEINALRAFLGLPAGALDASVLAAVKTKVADMHGKGEKKDAKPAEPKSAEKAPAAATGITFPDDFSPENKAIIEKEYAGLLDPKKIKIEGGPKGSVVEKVGAYDLGVEITLKGVTDEIKFAYDSGTKSVDPSHGYLMIEGSPYDVTWDQKNTLSLKPSDITDLQKRFPGFFPTTKIRLTGELPSDFPEGKIKAVAMNSLVFVIQGENEASINSATIAEDNKAIQVFNRIPYTLTIDPNKGTIDFKKMVSDENVRKIYEAFGLKGDEESIAVKDQRNIINKIKATEFSITEEGKVDMGDTPITLDPKDIGKKKTKLTYGGTREAEYSYERATKTLTLGDTPRQRVIDGVRGNENIKGQVTPHTDPKYPGFIDMSLDGKTFFGVFSLKQAAVIGRYHQMVTKYSMYENTSKPIKLTANRLPNGNLSMDCIESGKNSLRIIITPNGDISALVERDGSIEAVKSFLRTTFSREKALPIPSQQALIDEINALISQTPNQ